MILRALPVTPVFAPPETLSEHLKKRLDPVLDLYDYIILVDADTHVPDSFWYLGLDYTADIILPRHVRSSSIIYRFLDLFSDRMVLEQRMRGCAVWYSTLFLKRVGGWPLVMTPDTWLRQHATNIRTVNMTVYHDQKFSLRKGYQNQLRDGFSRAELRYPVWKTLLHSIFRLRPFVIFGYLVARRRKS